MFVKQIQNPEPADHKSLNPTPAEAGTFAEAAAKAPKKKMPYSKGKMIKVRSLLSPRPPPIEFTKMWIKVGRPDLLKACTNSREVTIMLREALKAMKIYSDVVQH